MNCDVVTVRNAVKKMQESDMLAKTEDERVWMINPRLLVKGDIYVQARLMSEYDTLLNRPLSDLLITDGDGNDPLFLPREYSAPASISNVKMNFLKCMIHFLELFPDWAERNHWCWIFWYVQCRAVTICTLEQ